LHEEIGEGLFDRNDDVVQLRLETIRGVLCELLALLLASLLREAHRRSVPRPSARPLFLLLETDPEIDLCTRGWIGLVAPRKSLAGNRVVIALHRREPFLEERLGGGFVRIRDRRCDGESREDESGSSGDPREG